MEEVLKFTDFATDYAAIIRVDIPTIALKNFNVTRGQIDPFIFKSGVLTIDGQGSLNMMNRMVKSVIHAY